MNNERRLLIQEIVGQLEQTNEKLRRVWMEEDGAYERRSAASKETETGASSREAIDDFELASDRIEEGCELLRNIVARAS
jgi:hypothetical protein